jgi:hypothetical protein
MRLSFAFLVAVVPSAAFARTKEIDDAVRARLAAVKWVLAQEDPGGGFRLAPKDAKGDAARPGLRATNGAVRALRYLGAEVPNKEKHAAFVLTCYDPKTGAFAEPGGKPDVAITAIGVMAAAELGIPKDKYAKAMDYLKENAKTFEDVRIGAAAVEAWGVKDCPFDLKPWVKVAEEFAAQADPKEDPARGAGSVAAMYLRLNRELPINFALVPTILNPGQRQDGGWGKAEGDSDIETTYRVMRAYHLLKEKPKDVTAVRKFIAAHRNADGGYATRPGDPSTMSGAYYAAVITKWLDEAEKK